MLEKQAEEWLAADDVPTASRVFRRYVEARYEGQSFEVRVEFDRPISDVSLTTFIAAFHAEHKAQYSYDIQERIVEIVNCRLEAVGVTPKPPMRSAEGQAGMESVIDRRQVHFGANGGWQQAAVHDRAQLTPGTSIAGPAVVEEMSSTTIVPPNHHATVDDIGNLIMEQST